MGVSTIAMPSNFTLSDRRDRARSVAATAAIHLALGTALLAGLTLEVDRTADDALKTFDVVPPATRPPPAADRLEPTATDRPSPAGKQADPSPILAPPERLPSPKTIAATPAAGTGSSSNAGATASGSGTGAGGTGDGGRGAGGGGIGTDAQMLGGYRGRVARQLLRPFAGDHGYAHLVLTIADTGQVTACEVSQSSGSAAVDQAFCEIMIGQSRWSPARDTTGRPISVEKRWTATWRK